MFEISIKSSKDISELHINFSDGTSKIIEDNKNVNKSQNENTKTNTRRTNDTINQNGQKFNVRRTNKHNNSKGARKDLLEYANDVLDFSEKEIVFEHLKPPEIKEINREINVSEETKNGVY